LSNGKYFCTIFVKIKNKQKLGKTKKIIYPSELFFFLYVSFSERKKITSSPGVDYFLPLRLNYRKVRAGSTVLCLHSKLLNIMTPSRIVRAGLLMYRYGTGGLEIFLVNDEADKSEGKTAWSIPNGRVNMDENSFHAAKREFARETGIEPEVQEFIDLDCVECQDGKVKAWAFEKSSVADLPFNKILSTESPLRLRRKHKMLVEKGTWFCTKEAIKKVFPAEVELIKELRDVLTDRNQAGYV